MSREEEILSVEHLKIWDDRDQDLIIDDISFCLDRHSCLAIVGESGSGKSMTAKAISGIHKPWIRTSGQIRFQGVDLTDCSGKVRRQMRGARIFMIFQDGMSAFDPSATIAGSMREIIGANRDLTRREIDELAVSCMSKVRLKHPEQLLGKYPHQLSGGMLQRVMIALALALESDLIIADEPTTALDTITQYEVIEEFIRLREERGIAMIFISHDLGLVRRLADRVVVMQGGRIVEAGSREEIFETPREEYTKFLIGTRRLLGRHYQELLGAPGDGSHPSIPAESGPDRPALPALEVREVCKSYRRGGLFSGHRDEILHEVSFSMEEGRCTAIIGESGSGKSTLCRMILGIEKADRGETRLFGREVSDRKTRRRAISAVFQDYTSSICPKYRVYEAIREPLRYSGLPDDRESVTELLLQVGLSADYLDRYQHELSGGQVQRVCIARAMATRPRLLLLDEAISSLDVSVQVQILQLLKRLREETGMGYLFVTHDIQAAAYICDDLIIFHEGRIVERVEVEKLGQVREEYSKKLLHAVLTV